MNVNKEFYELSPFLKISLNILRIIFLKSWDLYRLIFFVFL